MMHELHVFCCGWAFAFAISFAFQGRFRWAIAMLAAGTLNGFLAWGIIK